MRKVEALRDYFDYYLHHHRNRGQTAALRDTPGAMKEGTRVPVDVVHHHRLHPSKLFKGKSEPKERSTSFPQRTHEKVEIGRDSTSPEDGADGEGMRYESEVDEVVLVRKLGALASLRARRQAVLRQLEVVRRISSDGA